MKLGRFAVLAALLTGCGGGAAPETVEPALAPPAAVPVVGPALLMVQAQFVKDAAGKTVPGPAKLVIWREGAEGWSQELLEDPESNVFHKAMAWRDGFLTIGAMGAKLKYWTRDGASWRSQTLWERSWGGPFDRLRDLEIGDVDGDGQDELVLATHDMGVVAVGDEVDGVWTFQEMDQAADTFVHEIEIGDVDGDGREEFYATPSARNRASMESQPGGVVRYDYTDGAYVRSQVAHWEASHAKEILVTPVDGRDALFAVREAHTRKGAGGAVEIVEPVQIYRYTPSEAGWSQEVAGVLQDQQCRFLVPGDVDGDGQLELVAAGYKSGLWVFQPGADGSWTPELIDADSGGYEHATHVTDLDGDGALEIYVAADKQRQLRRYRWKDGAWKREVIGAIPELHITWNLQDGVL
ncbi:MAG: VCBS repeat-containing protein [Deltaproteobacteria bacterium]|nr:VCBS repeat-containing protein [Deltaproteobacteria bacterium]